VILEPIVEVIVAHQLDLYPCHFWRMVEQAYCNSPQCIGCHRLLLSFVFKSYPFLADANPATGKRVV
jgi:hypothetical protein